jgi:DNA-directed RNA polymerase subunit B
MSTRNEDFWFLMRSFFDEEGLVRQHLNSYNSFIKFDLQKIIEEVGEIPITTPNFPFKVRLKKIEVGRPRIVEVDESAHIIQPTEARLRNLSYAAPLYLELCCVRDEREELSESVHIGDLPVMLKSKLCVLHNNSVNELIEAGEDPNDPGGYFIINGSERVIVSLEDLAPNRILVDYDKSGNKLIYVARVFSTTVGFRARITCKIKTDNNIVVTVPGVPAEIPFVILTRALGVESDKEIADMISTNVKIQNQLEKSFEEVFSVNTVTEAIKYIGNRVAHGQIEEYRLRRAESILDRNLLPHLGNSNENRKDKAYFLCEMALRSIELKLGFRDKDDKDHYSNKRLKLAGSLLAELFRAAFRNLTRDIKYQLERMSVRRKKISISASVRHGIITDRVQHALATGNWGHGRVGITQLLDRTNYLSMLSHLRRLQSPLSRSQPNFEARDLHSTHWGRLCPNETPEGSNCGLVKNLALMANISVGSNANAIKELLYKLGAINSLDADIDTRVNGVKVFIDGALVGYTMNPTSFVTVFRQMRRLGEISSEINIAYHIDSRADWASQEISVNCDMGRVRRPLLIVENMEPLIDKKDFEMLRSGDLTWVDLLHKGFIEYVDADEEENCFVSITPFDLKPWHTHLEISPFTIFGICAAIIPYAENNQSPRNSYEAAMAKQALGVYNINYLNRVDTQSHILHYPQIPLVKTKPMDILGYYARPSGQNFIVAVLSYGGYNMEDAIVFNKSSIERGIARSFFFRVHKAESRRYLGGLKDKFEIPGSGTRGFRGEQYYNFLEDDGIISKESYVSGNDVLVGRTSPPRFLEEYREFEVKGPTRRDTSATMRPTERGVVDEIFITTSIQGGELVKVKVRDERVPELGDKFASRHGQKGVIGIVIPQEDMPFTDQGIIPDVIINPHTLPSRMTVGQLVESLAGKVSALTGTIIDGTPFDNTQQDQLRQILGDLGFHYSGKETMYNGITGERLETDVFMGVVYYQKLHHMVADKMHARARGQVAMLTRQPTEGRSRGGGLRFGEMERDCLIGHGAAILLKDRLLEESDKSIIYICETCGYLSYYDFRQRRYVCKICDENASIYPVTVSYAFKLLIQELMALTISPKLVLGERA